MLEEAADKYLLEEVAKQTWIMNRLDQKFASTANVTQEALIASNQLSAALLRGRFISRGSIIWQRFRDDIETFRVLVNRAEVIKKDESQTSTVVKLTPIDAFELLEAMLSYVGIALPKGPSIRELEAHTLKKQGQRVVDFDVPKDLFLLNRKQLCKTNSADTCNSGSRLNSPFGISLALCQCLLMMTLYLPRNGSQPHCMQSKTCLDLVRPWKRCCACTTSLRR